MGWIESLFDAAENDPQSRPVDPQRAPRVKRPPENPPEVPKVPFSARYGGKRPDPTAPYYESAPQPKPSGSEGFHRAPREFNETYKPMRQKSLEEHLADRGMKLEDFSGS